MKTRQDYLYQSNLVQKELFVPNFKKITPNFDLWSSDTHVRVYKYIDNLYNYTCKNRAKIIIREFYRKM